VPLQPIAEWWALKLGSKTKNWQRRYFRLYQTALFYFHDDSRKLHRKKVLGFWLLKDIDPASVRTALGVPEILEIEDVKAAHNTLFSARPEGDLSLRLAVVSSWLGRHLFLDFDSTSEMHEAVAQIKTVATRVVQELDPILDQVLPSAAAAAAVPSRLSLPPLPLCLSSFCCWC